jgi:tetratricopeptide (TPR) repeat protein
MHPNYSVFYRESRWSRAKSRLGKFGKWASGIAGGLFVLYATALVTGFVPPPDLARNVECRWQEWRSAPAPGTHFTILISNLAGDTDDRQTKHVRDVFLGERGFDVRRTCRVVALDAVAGSVAHAEGQALRRGRTLLADWNADLLVWGEVKKADQELSLWFLAGDQSTLGSPSYSLTEKLSLPEKFETDLSSQIIAVAAAGIAPATEQAGTYLVDILRPVAAKLERLVASPPAGFDAKRIADLQFSLGLATETIGEQSRDSEALGAAVVAYRSALQERTRGRVPLDWAQTQNHLGNVLRLLGQEDPGTALLVEALAAYRAAIEERTRERAPLQWASTQNNLGNVLANLGEREPGAERLEQAVATYRTTLEERTRERVPLGWAQTQHNLGTALTSLGEREAGTARLKQAVGAYEAALEERTRERVPLAWAMTQNNLANALSTLGEREAGTARLEQAVVAYEAALEERTRERYPFLWALTQENRGLALQVLGEREQSAGRLEQAVAAMHGTLEVFEESGASYNVEKAKRNLASAEAALARLRESEVAR